ncbi:MAG: malto-oligosyltrehalose trehalohydrolase [Actinobacteria bacterium]|nr:malto-oligosyltrehalose trehalohydrolase [Actinomycetota bacterium]
MTRLGARPLADGTTEFCVWAPVATRASVVSEGTRYDLTSRVHGYFDGIFPIEAGARYRFALDDDEPLADPASRSQPDGVHGESEVVDLSAFDWTDGTWEGMKPGVPIMEIHAGTFSSEGTFDGVIPSLRELRALGIGAIEIMPVAQFPGARNWGYDGVFPYAVQNTYGGPPGLMRLVDAAHREGIAVILDVVYNHLGPEGAVHDRFGPYFTDRYRTPWGRAVNVDGPGSDEVRRYFIENALQWLVDLHIDGLRLDAVHGIFDTSPYPFLAELADAVAPTGKVLIAESETNDRRVVTPRAHDGLGVDAVWSDDFHHAVHAIVTGEDDGYYCDYGSVELLARAYTDGFAYQGEYSAYRDRRHGSTAGGLLAERFVVAIQNHDQIGNRAFGERLDRLCSFAQRKLATGLLLTSPFVPLIFMGEEYGEEAPFLYFVSHTDRALLEAVRKGRAEEFAAFGWKDEPPDPGDEKTFLRCVLDRSLRNDGTHAHLYELYRTLLALRARPALATGHKENASVECDGSTMIARRHAGGDEVTIVFNLGDVATAVSIPGARRRVALDSEDARFGGSTPCVPDGARAQLAPWSFVILEDA